MPLFGERRLTVTFDFTQGLAAGERLVWYENAATKDRVSTYLRDMVAASFATTQNGDDDEALH